MAGVLIGGANLAPLTFDVTVRDWIGDVRRHLAGDRPDELNQLTNAVGVGDTTLELRRAASRLAAGSRLSIGQETLHVWGVNEGGSVEVLRGAQGTEPTLHAAGELVLVNPVWTDGEVWRALAAELHALSSAGMHGVSHLTRTLRSGVYTYDLDPAASTDSVLDIDYEVTPGEWSPISHWRIDSDAQQATYPSQHSLVLATVPRDGATLRVAVRTTLTIPTSLDDPGGRATGLAPTALDLPPLGAAVRLALGRPVQRANTSVQPQTRRADEVTVTNTLNAPSLLQRQRDVRLGEELLAQRRRWPQRVKPAGRAR